MGPILLERILKKLEGLKQHKRDQVRGWREVCEKNFLKGLDHRSIFFKQNEKKLVSSKNFMTEIKARTARSTSCANTLRGGTPTCEFFHNTEAESCQDCLNPRLADSDDPLVTL